MIKVNLLTRATRPVDGATSNLETLGDEKEIQKQGIVKLILILLPAIGLYTLEMTTIPALQSERGRLQTSLNSLKSFNAGAEAAVREIKKFKEDEERIQKRIEALQKLSKSRTNEIKILKLLADVIPEKAWLNSVNVSQNRANIVGLAVSNADVNNFAEKLKSNILVADLQLVRIAEERLDNGAPLTRFEFNCLLESRK